MNRTFLSGAAILAMALGVALMGSEEKAVAGWGCGGVVSHCAGYADCCGVQAHRVRRVCHGIAQRRAHRHHRRALRCFGRCAGVADCCGPVAPAYCAPAPTCCAPAVTCCAPVQVCAPVQCEPVCGTPIPQGDAAPPAPPVPPAPEGYEGGDVPPAPPEGDAAA